MADIRAFRGFRFDLGRVGSLSDVVAPPYDVISPEFQQQLYDRSPFNAHSGRRVFDPRIGVRVGTTSSGATIGWRAKTS